MKNVDTKKLQNLPVNEWRWRKVVIHLSYIYEIVDDTNDKGKEKHEVIN